jgi:hypothetical protein
VLPLDIVWPLVLRRDILECRHFRRETLPPVQARMSTAWFRLAGVGKISLFVLPRNPAHEKLTTIFPKRPKTVYTNSWKYV